MEARFQIAVRIKGYNRRLCALHLDYGALSRTPKAIFMKIHPQNTPLFFAYKKHPLRRGV